MRIAYWTLNATVTRSENVILIAFPLQRLLDERASMLHFHCISRALPFISIVSQRAL